MQNKMQSSAKYKKNIKMAEEMYNKKKQIIEAEAKDKKLPIENPLITNPIEEMRKKQKNSSSFIPHIRFLDNGDVAYSVNGKTKILSRDEYNNLKEYQKSKIHADADTEQFYDPETVNLENKRKQMIAEGDKYKEDLLMQQKLEELQPLLGQIEKVGDPNMVAPEDLTKKGLTSVAGTIATGALTGGGIGAVAGGIGGAGVGAIPGAIVGASVGALSGVVTGIFSERRQGVSDAYNEFTESKKVITKLVNALNQGLISPEEAIIKYNQEIQIIKRSKAELKWQTRDFAQEFVSGGADELADIIAYERVLDTYFEPTLQQAILNPNPNLIINDYALE